MAATQPIRSKKQLRKLADFFISRGELRNYALIVVCAHTALRISDVLSLRWNDIYDFERNRIRDSITLTELKTGKSKSLKLHRNAAKALLIYMSSKKSDRNSFIFISRKGKNNAISRVQAYRIIRAAAEAIDRKSVV